MYSVVVNQPGYLPDSTEDLGAGFPTIGEARLCLIEEVEVTLAGSPEDQRPNRAESERIAADILLADVGDSVVVAGYAHTIIRVEG